MKDVLGQRGEAIFFVQMTEWHFGTGPLFRPQFLGDKWPLVDFIVELEDTGAAKPFFFVQVKTTRRGYTKRENRLKISIPKEDIQGLAGYPAPTYVLGIDEVSEIGFLVSANGERPNSLSSLSTLFPINSMNREALWKEVNGFWAAMPPMPKLASVFSDANWR